MRTPRTRESDAWRRAGLPPRFRKICDEDTRLGQGSCGEVVKAWDCAQSRYVAVKGSLKQAAFARNAQSLAGCVEQEYATLRALEHPHLPIVLAQGRRDRGIARKDRAYLVTEWIDGAELGSVGLGTMPRQAMLGVLTGLAHVHRRGYVHGDIHSGNVLRTRDRTVLIDFDLSSKAEAAGAPEEAVHEDVMAAMALLGYEAQLSGLSAGEVSRFATAPTVQAWLAGEPPAEQALRAHPFFYSGGTQEAPCFT